MTFVEAFTVGQVARKLQCHELTVRRLINRGVLHAVKVGSSWRVPCASLDDFLSGEPPVAAPVPACVVEFRQS